MLRFLTQHKKHPTRVFSLIKKKLLAFFLRSAVSSGVSLKKQPTLDSCFKPEILKVT
jgi:hypothetical protein